MMTQVLEPLPAVWEAWLEFQLLLAWAWSFCNHLGECTSNEIILSPSPLPRSTALSLFQSPFCSLNK